MASQNFLIRTKGVQTLKKLLTNVVPVRFHQSAIRDFKYWMRLCNKKEELSEKLEPIYDQIFTDDGVNTDVIQNFWDDLNGSIGLELKLKL